MTTPTASTTSQSRKKRVGRLRVLALVLAGLFVLTAAAVQLFFGPIIQEKLKATVAAHLDASLSIGSLTYAPPFTVHLYDVHFLAHPKQSGGGTEILAARRIDLSLAKLPLGPGPLIIEKFGLLGLTLHAIRGADGKYVGLDLARDQTESAPSSAAMKLSDVLRLRHFSLKEGTIIYQDQGNPKSAAVEWRGISSDVALAPKSDSLYGFHLNASDDPIARAGVDGSIDVDSFLLKIDQLTASVQAPSEDSPSVGADPLPTEIRDLIHRYTVKGTISLTTAGTIPLRNPQQASLTGDLGVERGGATIPDGGEKLDDLSLSTHIERGTWRATDQQVKIDLRRFRAVSGGAILHASSAMALLDPGTGKWSINGMFGSLDAPAESHGPWGLTGHADFHADVAHDPRSNQTPFVGGINIIGINVHPPGLAAALQGLTGNIRFAGSDANDRQITLQNFFTHYGGDNLMLDHAQIVLQQFPSRIGVNDIKSRVDLVQNAPMCPGDLGDLLQTFQPSGSFVITGTVALEHVIRDDGPGYSPEWDLDIETQDGNLALLDERLPVTGLKGRMLATKHAISIPQLQGNLLGGSMDLVASARVVEPIVYQGEFNELGADVQQFAKVFNLRSPDGSDPTGAANLKFNFFSQTPSPATTSSSSTQPSSEVDKWLSLLGGDGRLQIDKGNLWALPALQSLSRHTQIAREALTAGEAAAIFSVANRTIYFKHVAIYSPALGLQGSGTETFDGMMNLDIIAAPLGDWKQKLAETDVPFFSRVLSSAAGSIEKLVGNATSELLYHFRVTGSRDNPRIQTIPAPFITDSAASLFARMIRHDDNTKLVDAVGDK